MPDFSETQRENLAEKGQAMPSGGYPIRNRADLKRAIQAFGRAKNPEQTKAWILKRAKELDAMDLIPEKWLEKEEATHMETDVESFLAHHGIQIDSELKHYGRKGMKWKQNLFSKEDQIDIMRQKAKVQKLIGSLNLAEKRNLRAAVKNGAKIAMRDGKLGYEYHGPDRFAKAMKDVKAGYQANATTDTPFVEAKRDKNRKSDIELGA